jgi:hypothetical protein
MKENLDFIDIKHNYIVFTMLRRKGNNYIRKRERNKKLNKRLHYYK